MLLKDGRQVIQLIRLQLHLTAWPLVIFIRLKGNDQRQFKFILCPMYGLIVIEITLFGQEWWRKYISHRFYLINQLLLCFF